MPRLTKLEKEMLSRAARFALAGEWPWEASQTPTKRQERLQEREIAALESAADKLETE